MARIIRPDLHEFRPDIQPEIIIHASECLTGAKRLWPDNDNAVHRCVACLKMQEQRRGAVTAANDAKAGWHYPRHPSAKAFGRRGEVVEGGFHPIEHVVQFITIDHQGRAEPDNVARKGA